MELDSLKELWRDIGQRDVPQETDEQILGMLQKRSKSPIAKMKHNLRKELVAVIILYSLSIAYFLTASNSRYWELALLLLVIAIFFGFYYYHKNKLLREMQCVTCEVRSNLEKQLITLEKFVRFYFISGTVLMPIAYFATAFIVWIKSPVSATVYRSPDRLEYIILIGIGLAITVAGYFLNIWYVNKLYGQHVKKLKKLLSEIEGKETEF